MESQGAAFVHNGEGEKLYRGGYFWPAADCQIEAGQAKLYPRYPQFKINTIGYKGEKSGVPAFDWQMRQNGPPPSVLPA